MSTPEPTRVNCELIPDAAQALARLGERTGMRKTDLVNRALQVYDFVEGELRQGNQILIKSPDGGLQVVKIL